MKRILALALSVVLLLLPACQAADLKISQLGTAPAATSSDEFPVNQGGTTKKVTLTQIDTALGVSTHINNATIHRSINDSGSGATDLWSASKIITQLGLKANTSHTHAASDITSGSLAVSRGGTGLSTIPASRILYTSGLDVIAPLSLDSTLGISTNTLGVQSNSSTQRVIVSKGGTTIGTRKQINLIEGVGITLSTADDVANDRVNVTITGIASSYPTGHHGSASPVYASSSSFTVAAIRERDSADAANITKSTSTTVSTATVGAINGIAQSSNLTGTISVTASSASTTFSSSQSSALQAGDVVCTNGGQCRRLASGSGTSWTAESNWTSTETTVSVKRGGKAPNTWYNLYAIDNSATPGLILSTRNVAGGDTLVDLPSGYTISRQLPFALRLDASSNVLPFRIPFGWPARPYIQWDLPITRVTATATITAGTPVVVSAGNATTATAVSLTGFVPPVSRFVRFSGHGGRSGGVFASIRETGTSNEFPIVDSSAWGTGTQEISCNASQSIDYYLRISGGSLYLDVIGFYVTEVP